MKNWRSGFSNILVLVFLIGLVVSMIAIFNSQGLQSAGPSTSPVPTVVGVQISPLATITANGVPVARLGKSILLQAAGPNGQLNLDLDKFVMAAGERGTVLLDATTGLTRALATTGLANAHVSDHWLVYQDRPSSSTPETYYNRIKIVDLDTGKETLLGDQYANQQNPRISDGIVVWDEARNGQRSSIYAYDLTTNKTITVVVSDGVRGYPRISGQWIVYVQWPGQNPTGWESPVELRIHSLTTGEDFLVGPMPITKDSSSLTRYAIDGDKIVWVKYLATGQYELRLYDLATRTDRLLVETKHPPSSLSLSANSGIIVYYDEAYRKVLDWRQPTPTIISATPPVKTPQGYELSVTGHYLVWKIPLDHDLTTGQIFVTPIQR